jgi:hypothetical protein
VTVCAIFFRPPAALSVLTSLFSLLFFLLFCLSFSVCALLCLPSALSARPSSLSVLSVCPVLGLASSARRSFCHLVCLSSGLRSVLRSVLWSVCPPICLSPYLSVLRSQSTRRLASVLSIPCSVHSLPCLSRLDLSIVRPLPDRCPALRPGRR